MSERRRNMREVHRRPDGTTEEGPIRAMADVFPVQVVGQDLEEAARIVREGTTEDLAAFISKDVEQRATQAADAARGHSEGSDFESEGFAPDTEMPAERTRPTSRHTLDGEDYSA